MKRIVIFDQAESYGGSIARCLDIIKATPEYNYLLFTYIDITPIVEELSLPNLKTIRVKSYFSYQKKLIIKRKIKNIEKMSSVIKLLNDKTLALFDIVNEIWVATQIRWSLRGNKSAILVSNSNMHPVPMRLNRTLRCYHIVVFRSLDHLTRWSESTTEVDKFVSISAPLHQIYKKQLGIPESKATIIGDPVNANEELQQQRRSAKPENRVLPGKFTIVCAARICRQKGQLDACRAFYDSGIWTHSQLIIVGKADPDENSQKYLQEIHDFIDQNDLSGYIKLVGFQTNPLIWVDSAQIALHCATDFEGLGSSVIEAMQLGKIVIASDNGGPSSYIEHGINGFLYKSKDVKQLSETLSFAFTEYNNLSSISTKAMLDSTNQFSVQVISEKFRELFHDAFR